MCGIFGVINTKDKIDEGRVLAARDILAHRGPDDAGVYFSPNNERSLASARDDSSESPYVALAHRRLSIIDLSPAAHQPMIAEIERLKDYKIEGIRNEDAKSLEQNAEDRPFDSPDPSSLDSARDDTELRVKAGQAAQGDGQAAPRYVIVFNGEIYNYVELSQKSPIGMASQKVKSQKLRSNSDTEVILNLFAEYGKECVNMLRGMFAFAIWDDKEKTLFAARDRFGIKPFYYYKSETKFIFSSELKAIKHYKKDLTISKEGIDAFLRTGSVPAPLTIYNEVSSLLPGNYLEIKIVETKHASSLQSGRKIDPSPFDSAQGDTIRVTIEKYWEFGEMMVDGKWLMDDGKKVLDSRLRENDSSKENEGHTSSLVSARDDTSADSVQAKLSMTTDQHQVSGIPHSGIQHQSHKLKYDSNAKKIIRAALLDSVRAHMVSDVEVGAFLSGGIDSTAIVSLMRQVGQEKIKTVSVVFPGNKLDESKYSRLAAKYYKTEHIEIPFYEKDLIDDFEKIMASMDQPTIDGINTYFVSKAAKQAGLKVVLSGLGGDELFGGYPSFINIPKYQRIKNLPFAKMFMKAAAPLLKNKLPAKAIHFMQNPDELNAEYKLIRGLFTDSELQSLGWISGIKNSKLKIQNSLNDSSSVPGSMRSALRPPSTNDPMTTNDKSHFDPPRRAGYAQYDKDIEGISGLVKVSYLESCHYMRNQLLRDSDVFSMAHSLELRVPFVDHLLYETVLNYIDDGFDKYFPKKMLVDAVGDIPLELINRPKMGFTFPFADWISKGQLKDLIIERLKNSELIHHYGLNIGHSKLDIEKVHWSRLWTLYVISLFNN